MKIRKKAARRIPRSASAKKLVLEVRSLAAKKPRVIGEVAISTGSAAA